MKIYLTRMLSLLLALVLVGSMMPAAMAASYDGAGETEPSSSGDALADLPDPIEGYDPNDPDNPYPYGLPVTEVVPEEVLELINSEMYGISLMAADNQGNIPDEMWDNTILRALEYTGYDVQKQKDNGQLYQYKYMASRLLENDPDVLSNIGYWDSGSCPNGDETIADASTVTGLAPKISYFESNGLVCASFVTYYLCNYLPNIEGIDTSVVYEKAKEYGKDSRYDNVYYLTTVALWKNTLDALSKEADSGVTKYTDESTAYDNLVPGDVIVFAKSSGTLAHVGIYAGEYQLYNGSSNLGTYHFLIHVGNSRGPEITIAEWMSTSSGDKASSPIAWYHLDFNDIQENGFIKVNKKDANGNALAGACFVATNTATQQQYAIGPTDSTGYAISGELPLGTYTVVETVFPEGYQASGQSSWTVTLTASTPNMTITIDAVNERITSGLALQKTTEDGKNLAGWQFGIYADAACTTLISGPHTTDANGKISVTGLTPQTVYVKELGHKDSAINALYSCGSTNPQKVELVANQTATVSFYNKLNLGGVKLIKTTNTGKNLGGWSIGLYTDAAGQNPVSGSPFTTAADGTITVTGLKPGTYYAKELPGGDGYWVCDTAVKTVTVVANQTASVTFSNTHYGRIAVQKHTNTGNHLGGWVFTIRDSNGNVAAELTTDDNGYAVTGNLPLGKYTIQEKYTDDDYWQVELGFHDVTVKAGETVVDEWTNIEQGLGWFYKETNTAASNEGWEITIYTDEACTQEYRTVVTGEGGKIGLYLNPGVYWAKETGDTLGRFDDEYWQIDPAVQRFEIKPHEDTSITFQNVHLGKAQIIKKATNGGSVSGWHFEVKDAAGNVVGNYTTDATGIITLELEPGTYTVVETDGAYEYWHNDPNPTKTVTVKAGETAKVTFTNQWIGKAQIVKTATNGGSVSGWHFEVRDSGGNVVGSYVTDSTGIITIDLQPGDYTVVETDGEYPYWHNDPNPTKSITVNAGETSSVTFENRWVGKAKVIKVLSNPEAGSVAGWTFTIHRLNGTETQYVATVTTGEDGTITYDLEPGEYLITEEVAEDSIWECASGISQTITVTAGQTAEVSFTNALRPGKIQIQKVDTQGQPLAGVEFLLEWSEDGVNWQPVTFTDATAPQIGGCTTEGVTDGKLKSDANGAVVFDGLHPLLQYRLTETATLDGYQLLAGTAYEGELPLDEDFTVTLTVVNAEAFTLPKTGSKSLVLMPIALVLCLVTCASALVLLRKKEGR